MDFYQIQRVCVVILLLEFTRDDRQHFQILQKYQLSWDLLGQKIPMQSSLHVSRTSFRVFFLFLLWNPLKAGLNIEWTVENTQICHILLLIYKK